MPDTTLRWDPHLEIALPALTGSWIDGGWVAEAGAEEVVVEDPALGRPIATLAEANAATVDRAVSAARAALNGPWGKTDPAQRGRVLNAIAVAIRAEADTLATMESVDSGKPLSQARGDVEVAARYFEYYAGMADKILGETIPQAAGTFVYTLREPRASSPTSRRGTHRYRRCRAGSRRTRGGQHRGGQARRADAAVIALVARLFDGRATGRGLQRHRRARTDHPQRPGAP